MTRQATRVSARPPRGVAAIYASAPLPHRATMLEMRRRILTILPGVNEVVRYGMAAFRLGDVTVCGLLAAKHHVGYYPFSGTVLPRLTSALEKYTTTKSALHVPVDRPLSRALLKKLIDTRLSQQPVRARSRDTSVIQRSDGEWCGIGLADPARRALVNEGIRSVNDLATWRESDVRALHGIGANGLVLIRREMRRRKIRFRET